MRISSKGRYALAGMIRMARQYPSGVYITVISLSEGLGISKVYLEQVFSLLKRGGLVKSVKGAQGGYQLSRTPGQITVLDVLVSVESSLFERTEETVKQAAPEIEGAIRQAVFDPLDQVVKEKLGNITLEDLVTEAERHNAEQAVMFYI